MTKAISVAQLNNYIKSVFDAEDMLHNVEVIGEISGSPRGSASPSNSTLFFSLKDEGASIPCTFFNYSGKPLKDGTKVVARGTVSYWHKAGKISFIVNRMTEFGMGALMLLFQQLQDKLKAEGLFDTATKKQIPDVVKRIGVVTSKTGAVIHDIVTVATRRNPAIDIVVVDTRVQGAGAETEIARAIDVLNTPFPDTKTPILDPTFASKNPNLPPIPPTKNPIPDVIIVARGGGSAEDLAPFNTEIVARAVFSSKIPVVSAVGHETDFTLIDFVADLRAPTPSVAAELCVREITTDRDRALSAWDTIKGLVWRKIDRQTMTAQNSWRDLKNATTAKLEALNGTLAVLTAQIEAKNPIAILQRGFAKPNTDLNKLTRGADFDLLVLGDNDKIKTGVAEWKGFKN